MSQAKQSLPPSLSFERSEQPDATCPNCGHAGLMLFYGVREVPVHSCILMPSQDIATGYPTGDLRLGYCPSCGFITNTLYDATVQEYSTKYEETQGFSETFNAFARSLAQTLIDRHGIRGKTVLEIGCGKGEFLGLMCKLGDNDGIGIDPAYVPERQPEGGSRVTFIQDFYSEKYSHLHADFICCRHTLEHIGPTQQFLRSLRESIGDRTDTLVFFEVPDALRVLREGAFWDIYFEHCSYFSPGSLARLFRAEGFDILDLSMEFDGQYLLITTKPVDRPTTPTFDLENDLSALAEGVEAFGTVCRDRILYWRQTVERINRAGERVAIWCSGSKAVAFLTTLKLGDGIEYVVDINPHKHGKFMPGTGQRIVSPEFLAEYRPRHVIVMNPIYCREIQRDLDRVGVQAELLPV